MASAASRWADDAVLKRAHGHPDFRVIWKIFATLHADHNGRVKHDASSRDVRTRKSDSVRARDGAWDRVAQTVMSALELKGTVDPVFVTGWDRLPG